MTMIALKGFTDTEFDKLACEVDKELIYSYFNNSKLKKTTLKQYWSSIMIFYKWFYENLYQEDGFKSITLTNGVKVTKPEKHGREEILDYRTSIVQLKPRDAKEYYYYLIDAGLSNHSIEFKKRSLASLYNYIIKFWQYEYPETRNVFKKDLPNLKYINKKNDVLKSLSKNDMSKIEKELIKNNEIQKLAFLYFLIETKCKREDILHLRKDLIYAEPFRDYNTSEIKYKTHDIERNGRYIKYTFSQKTMDMFIKLVNEREEKNKIDNCEYMFYSTKYGEPRRISPYTLSSWLKIFSNIIGKKINFSTFIENNKRRSISDSSYTIRII